MHEHIDSMEALALRQILSCIDMSRHGSAETLKEILETCRGCDRCWLQLVKELTAYAATGFEMVDFAELEAAGNGKETTPQRRELVATVLARELADVLDGGEQS